MRVHQGGPSGLQMGAVDLVLGLSELETLVALLDAHPSAFREVPAVFNLLNLHEHRSISSS